MKAGLIILLATGAAFLASKPEAHHSFPGMYDVDEQLILSGTATDFLFRNPHVFIYIQVEEENGETAQWHLELPPAVALGRAGMTAEAVQPGDVLLVTCNPARDGARSCGLGQRGGFIREADGFLYGRDPRQDMEGNP